MALLRGGSPWTPDRTLPVSTGSWRPAVGRWLWLPDRGDLRRGLGGRLGDGKADPRRPGPRPRLPPPASPPAPQPAAAGSRSLPAAVRDDPAPQGCLLRPHAIVAGGDAGRQRRSRARLGRGHAA